MLSILGCPEQAGPDKNRKPDWLTDPHNYKVGKKALGMPALMAQILPALLAQKLPAQLAQDTLTQMVQHYMKETTLEVVPVGKKTDIAARGWDCGIPNKGE